MGEGDAPVTSTLSVAVLLSGFESVAEVASAVGGIKAVIWTDVIQATIMFGTALLSIGMLLYHIGGFGVLGREMLLKKRIEASGIANEFDYLLLDCPPSLGLLTINALAVATEVIIPMLPHFLALQGMAKLLETIQLVNRRMNPQLKVSGIVLTMFDPQVKLSTEVVAELQGFIQNAIGKGLPWSEARIFQTRVRLEKSVAAMKQIYEADYGYRDVAARVESSYQRK